MPLYPNRFDYNITPADRGFLAEAYPVALSGSTVTPATAGRLEFSKIKLPIAGAVTNIVMLVTTAGGTLTAGQCFAALYTGAGVLLAQTADQAAAWVSTGTKTMALAGGAQNLPAGDYYVAYWYNGTTSPSWPRTQGNSQAINNVGLASPNLVAGSANTGLTTTAPGTLGAQTGLAQFVWAALS